MDRFGLLLLALLLCLVNAVPTEKEPSKHTVFSQTRKYPLPIQGNLQAHDPSILEHDNNFYLFKGGVHLPIFKAPSLSGPWKRVGTVLDGPSVIQKQNRTRPWAPTTIEHDGRFYCFYTISLHGSRNSAIGVATSGSMEPGSWTDHGALITTEKGPMSHIYPYTVSNAIDAAFITDQSSGQPYLLYGSYWHGIFQVPLADDLLSVKDPKYPDGKNLAYLPDEKPKAQEGSFMSFSKPYYYLWFSHGKCCHFNAGLPKMGQEYSIRVGRSSDVRGPFVDKNGVNLTAGGGTVVYGSNHGEVYAPGGLGVLTGNSSRQDILYYHYLNTTIGLGDPDTRLGWSYIDYVDGWPVAKAKPNRSAILRPNYTFNILAVLCMFCLVLLLLPSRFLRPRLIFLLALLVTGGFLWLHR